MAVLMVTVTYALTAEEVRALTLAERDPGAFLTRVGYEAVQDFAANAKAVQDKVDAARKEAPPL